MPIRSFEGITAGWQKVKKLSGLVIGGEAMFFPVNLKPAGQGVTSKRLKSIRRLPRGKSAFGLSPDTAIKFIMVMPQPGG